MKLIPRAYVTLDEALDQHYKDKKARIKKRDGKRIEERDGKRAKNVKKKIKKKLGK